MPLQEYKCTECGASTERLEKFSDAPLKKCPSCTDGKVEQQIGRTSFALKGRGWYKDGYSSRR